MKLHTLLHCLNRRDFQLIPKLSKKLKVTLIMFLIFGAFFLAKTNLAQSDTPNPTPTIDPAVQQKFAERGKAFKQKQDAMYKGNNQESWIGEALTSNALGGINMISGPIPFNEDGSINTQSYIPGGAIGTTNRFIASLYTPPASGIEYIAQVKDSFLGKPAYAQGVGFKGLSPLLPIWKTLRNVVYILSSLIFVGIGIAIVLRIKISPQAVISIQNSIPKLIAALILVTFSYAIAGLLIDLSYVVLSICLVIIYNSKERPYNFSPFGDLNPSSGMSLTFLGTLVESALGIFNLNQLTNANFYTVFSLANRAIPGATGWALGAFIGQIFLASLLGGVGGLVGNAAVGSAGGATVGTGLGHVGGAVGGVVGGVLGLILIPLIISILLVIWLIKLYFGMIKCYVTLIFKIIIAPLEIGLGALPNSKIGFSSWIRDVVANLAVFPITILFLVFINYIMDLVKGDMWMPSVLSTNMDWMYSSSDLISAAIGLAGLGMLSKLPKLVPEAIFSIKPSPFGAAIGESYTKNFLAKQASSIGQTARSEAVGNLMPQFGARARSGGQTRVRANVNTNAGNAGAPPPTP